MTPTQFSILIATLIPVAYVAVQTIIHHARKHAEQHEIQQAKWRVRFDEVRKKPVPLVNPPTRDRNRIARVG